MIDIIVLQETASSKYIAAMLNLNHAGEFSWLLMAMVVLPCQGGILIVNA